MRTQKFSFFSERRRIRRTGWGGLGRTCSWEGGSVGFTLCPGKHTVLMATPCTDADSLPTAPPPLPASGSPPSPDSRSSLPASLPPASCLFPNSPPSAGENLKLKSSCVTPQVQPSMSLHCSQIKDPAPGLGLQGPPVCLGPLPQPCSYPRPPRHHARPRSSPDTPFSAPVLCIMPFLLSHPSSSTKPCAPPCTPG